MSARGRLGRLAAALAPPSPYVREVKPAGPVNDRTPRRVGCPMIRRTCGGLTSSDPRQLPVSVAGELRGAPATAQPRVGAGWKGHRWPDVRPRRGYGQGQREHVQVAAWGDSVGHDPVGGVAPPARRGGRPHGLHRWRGRRCRPGTTPRRGLAKRGGGAAETVLRDGNRMRTAPPATVPSCCTAS